MFAIRQRDKVTHLHMQRIVRGRRVGEVYLAQFDAAPIEVAVDKAFQALIPEPYGNRSHSAEYAG